MELHAFEGQLAMTQAHNEAVGLSGYFQFAVLDARFPDSTRADFRDDG